MPAVILPFRPATALRRATWSLLEIARPGLQPGLQADVSPEPWGVLLVDEETGALTLRLKSENELEDPDETETDFLASLSRDLEGKAREAGGRELLSSLEDSLSGFLRISDRTAIEYSGEARITVDRLFDRLVGGDIRPFETHLPLYALRAAATKFGEELDPAEIGEPEEWLRAPQGLRLTENMFIAQVVGKSMEPLIPDGSYCIFRGPVTGSRQGKRLLIEQTGGSGADPASPYTVKRYTSRKKINEDGSWQHAAIRLEPLNPDFEAFDLNDEGAFRVIAEFVQVLS